MSGISIDSLLSRTERQKIGKRVISALQTKITLTSVINFVIKGAGSLKGFIAAGLSKLDFNISSMLGLAKRTFDFLYNFNWNTTDKQLESEIDGLIAQIGGQLGATIGNAVGYFTGGTIAGIAAYKFNPVLATLVVKDVTASGLDELVDNLKNLMFSVGALAIKVFFTTTFTNVRKMIKSQSVLIGKIFGNDKEKAIKAWGEEGTAAWSFASAKEEEYDEIKSPFWKNFWEEFDEEAYEGFWEAGFVAASTADQWIAQQKLDEMIAVENQKVVVVTPNRLVPDQKVILAGTGIDLRNQITSTLVTHQVMADRDVGIIYGTSDEQPVRSLKPEVILKFYQLKEDRIIQKGADGKAKLATPIRMQISFRLMNKSASDFENDTYIKQLAAKIYVEMATPPYKINRGAKPYSYADHAKGYQFLLWMNSEAEAKNVINRVLDIQSHKIEDEFFRPGSLPPNQPDVKKIQLLGQQVEIPTYKVKAGKVTFTGAFLNIGNGTPAIPLVDLTGKKKNVIFKS